MNKTLLAKQIKIGVAKTLEEKKEIYRFRYSIYAEEIDYKLVSVDHENRLLFDDLDKWGVLLYAKLGKEIVGSARLNIGKCTDFPAEVVESFLMKRFLQFYEGHDKYNFSLASKGMIAPPYRGSPVLTLIMEKMYELYCYYQIQFAFINCNFHLIPLHEHYGSHRLKKNILDPNTGPMTNFVFLADDVKHLERVGSPLFHLANTRKMFDCKSVKWFYTNFSDVLGTTVNSQLVTADELWTALCNHLGTAPNSIISVLDGLSEPEMKKLIHYCGIVVHCNAGDYIASRGDVSQELNILLSGKLQSSSVILPGRHFGGNGLVNRTKHTKTITAATGAEILVLSYHYFLKFRKSHPDIANKILQILARIQDTVN